MAHDREDSAERLADDVRAKLLSERELITKAEGAITLRIFPRGAGYDIKLNVTT